MIGAKTFNERSIDVFGATFEMAKTVTLVHPQESFQVLEKLLIQKCGLVTEDPILVTSPYTVRSKVSLSDIRTFVSALEGALLPITKDNMGGLTRLCEEFHFGELSGRLSQFRESDDLNEDVTLKDLEARKRLLALEEGMQQHDCEIAALRTELSRQSRLQESSSELLLVRVARLEAEVLALVSCFLKRNLLLERGALRFMCCSYCDL
jgi:hypothetical protein